MHRESELGRYGEDLAARDYQADGYEIVQRNFRCARGEIDLILRRGRALVFCEVKTRSTDHFGEPSEAVNPVKQARLRRLAAIWLSSRREPFSELRFDVVSIVSDPAGTNVRRLENAF